MSGASCGRMPPPTWQLKEQTMKRVLAVLCLALAVAVVPGSSQTAPSMTAHFIDVGQAQATLLEFPCGAMLIDAGAQDATHRTKLLGYLDRFFQRRKDLNRTLDTILVT